MLASSPFLSQHAGEKLDLYGLWEGKGVRVLHTFGVGWFHKVDVVADNPDRFGRHKIRMRKAEGPQELLCNAWIHSYKIQLAIWQAELPHPTCQ